MKNQVKLLNKKYMVYIITKGHKKSFFSYYYIGDLMKKLMLFLLIILLPIKVFGISTSGESAILMDMDTNRILYADNIHRVRSVASISKVMTAVIAIESGRLDEKVVINESIKRAYGSAIYIQVGEEMTLRDLVYGLMLRSGNDAALAIADFVGKDEFITMMNNKAEELGMKNTTFNNPSGLDEMDGNFSTAYDMAILTSYAMHLDEYKKIVGTKTYRLKTNKNYYIWNNKHKLLGLNNYISGGKTGFTKKAKRTLITTGSKNGLNLVAVTLNDGNDFKDHLNLLNYGFDNYHRYCFLKKGDLNLYDDIYYGIYNLSVDDDICYPLNKEDKVSLKYELNKVPKIGNTGALVVLVNDKEVLRKSIIGSKKKKKNKRGILDWIKSLW